MTNPRIAAPVETRTADATLIGHTAPVNAIAFHPAGRILASGGDVTARLWHDGEPGLVFTADAYVLSVAFSPDGAVLAIGDLSGGIALWTLGTDEVTPLTGPGGPVENLAFSPDGRALAASYAERVSRDGPPGMRPTVRVWDLTTRTPRVLSVRPGGYGHALAFSPDGRVLATSGGLDGSGQLLDPVTGDATAFTGHAGGIHTLAYSPDGILASGSVDSTIRLWRDPVLTLEPDAGYVTALAFSPDGRTLAGACAPAVRLWDSETGRHRATLFGPAEHVTGLAFAPDGSALAGAGHDRAIWLWNSR